MSESEFIDRKSPDAEVDSFDALKREGLAVIQELAGDVWTDYNLHDPGVTILEQLCYGLTDLIYRTDFEIEDFLTGPDGEIEFEGQCLYLPEQILPSRPTTDRDYRQLILDGVPDIDNVNLSPCPAQVGGAGLYRIEVWAPAADESQREAIIREVEAVYSRHRNLCEDVVSISITSEDYFDLEGTLEIEGGRRPAEILAEVYHECAKAMAGGIRQYPAEEALAEGQVIDEVLAGPLLTHGLFRQDELERLERGSAASRLFSVINRIDGVDHIRELKFPRRLTAKARVRIPRAAGDIGLRLQSRGRTISVAMDELRARLDELAFRHRALRKSTRDPARLKAPPRGTFRDFDQYYSIQNHFPLIYGISGFGLPDSASDADKARVAQLKAYLLLFEQILASGLAGLAGIRSLFGVGHETESSYVFPPIGNDCVRNIGSIYADAGDPGAILGQLLETYDPSTERRSRVADYLLALYGEKFSQRSLQHFGYYDAPGATEVRIVENKSQLLRSLVEITRDRAGAYDYRRPYSDPDNVSGLAWRLSALLGFEQGCGRWLTAPFREHGLLLAPEDQEVAPGETILPGVVVDRDFRSLSADERTSVPAGEEPTKVIEGLAIRVGDLLGGALLRCGIQWDRYRLGREPVEGDYRVAYRDPDDQRWWELGRFSSEQAAVRSVQGLRQFLLGLNNETEGIHLVEHILLRSGSTPGYAHEGIAYPEGEDLYSFRLSFVFPAWTARCRDPGFRALAEETVRINCPAHIVPECHWLEFAAMWEFEGLFSKWMELKREGSEGADIDVAAAALIRFLLKRRGVARE
jgi:hypothetical protein